jgi:hypothetical protein
MAETRNSHRYKSVQKTDTSKTENQRGEVENNTITQYGVTFDGVLDSILDLTIIYVNDLKLQSITAPSMISKIYRSLLHTLRFFFQPAVSSLATASNSGDSSNSCAEALSERRLPTNYLFSSQTALQN